jgi:hypothetical protein
MDIGVKQPLLFNPQKKLRNSRVREEFRNIYTSRFKPEPTPTPTNQTEGSQKSEPESVKRATHFVNPRPLRAAGFFQSPQSRMERPEGAGTENNLEELSKKVEVLRRSVSQNRLINESRVHEMALKAERLREEYKRKERRLEQLVQTISHHFP